jgi:hypothetical protein
MLNIKDKELRKALFDAKIIYDPWCNTPLCNRESIVAESVVYRCNECFALLNAMADYLGIEAPSQYESRGKYFFVKKKASKSRKRKVIEFKSN